MGDGAEQQDDGAHSCGSFTRKGFWEPGSLFLICTMASYGVARTLLRQTFKLLQKSSPISDVPKSNTSIISSHSLSSSHV